MPHQIHQVGGILPVVNGEGLVDADVARIFAQQPRADGVECARPVELAGRCAGLRAENLSGDALDTSLHLRRGAPRESQQQNAARIDAADDEMRDPVRQGVGLA